MRRGPSSCIASSCGSRRSRVAMGKQGACSGSIRCAGITAACERRSCMGFILKRWPTESSMRSYAEPLDTSERFLIGEHGSSKRVVPHPDGMPWPKCCGTKANCQCAYRRATSGATRMATCCSFLSTTKTVLDHGGRFICVHRTTPEGYYRVCAGFAALDRGKDIKAGEGHAGV